MPHIGWPELVIILVVVLVVFGVGKLPQVGGALGKGIREFRKGQHGDYDGESKSVVKSETKEQEEAPPSKQG